MRIAFVARIPYNSKGGVRRVIDALSAGLRAKGHSVDVVLKKGSSSWSDFLTFPLFVFFRSLRSSWDVIIAHSGDGVLCAIFSGFWKRISPVIMHSHGWEEIAFVAWQDYGRQYGRGPSARNRMIAKFLRFPILRLCLKYAKASVFVSEEDRIWVGNKYPQYYSKLVHIPNGVDPQYFFPDPVWGFFEKNRIIFVGTWIWRKGNRLLIPVLLKIFDRYPNARAIFVGLGISELERKGIFSQFEPNRIDFYDDVPIEKMGEHYRKAALLIHTSLYEGGIPSLAILEAMATGLPVIAFKYPGIDRFLENGKDGILIETGNWKEMAQKVVSLLDSPQERRDLGETAIKKAAEYKWSLQVTRWNDFLKGLF